MLATIHFDGSANPNPGAMAIGALVEFENGRMPPIEVSERLPGTGTNNIAEYVAAIRGLQAAKDAGAQVVILVGDSKLVIQQLTGNWQVRDPVLRKLFFQLSALYRSFPRHEARWVPREQNGRADELSYRPFLEGAPAPVQALPDLLVASPPCTTRSVSVEPPWVERCPRCGVACRYTKKTTGDGRLQVRVDCPTHGYVKFAAQTPELLSRLGTA